MYVDAYAVCVFMNRQPKLQTNVFTAMTIVHAITLTNKAVSGGVSAEREEGGGRREE